MAPQTDFCALLLQLFVLLNSVNAPVLHPLCLHCSVTRCKKMQPLLKCQLQTSNLSFHI